MIIPDHDNSRMNYIRIWDYMIYQSDNEDTYNDTRIKWLMEQAEYAHSKNYRIVFSQLGGVPYWLQNRTNNPYCNSTDYNSCQPTNNTKFAIFLNRIITNLTQVIPEEDIDVEIMNEVYGTSFLNNGTNDDRVVIYTQLFNTTRNYLKQQHPNISVGWIGSYDSSEIYFYWIKGLVSNLTNNTDFINLHTYPSDFISTNTVYNNLKNLSDILDSYSVNPKPKIGYSEWNVWGNTYQWNFTRYSSEVAFAYQSVLNWNPANVSMMLFSWSNWESYTCSAYYPDYPINFAMWNEVDNVFKPTYNVTKDFSTYAPASSTIYSSFSDDSSSKILTSKKGNARNIIVINTDDEPANMTINITDSNMNSLRNMKTGAVYTISNNISQLGIVDSYEYIILGEDLQPPLITINSPINKTYNNTIVTFNITLDEEGDTCKYTLNNWKTNYTMTKTGVVTFFTAINSTMQQEDIRVKFWCNDSLNNINNTEYKDFSIDTVNPILTVSTPQTAQTYSTNDISISATLNEDGYCEYNMNSEPTRALTKSAFTFTDTYTTNNIGTFTLYILCNDTVNRFSNATIVFNKAKAGSDTGDSGGAGTPAVNQTSEATNYTFYIDISETGTWKLDDKNYLRIFIFEKDENENAVYIKPETLVINYSIPETINLEPIKIDNNEVGHYIQEVFIDTLDNSVTSSKISGLITAINKNKTVIYPFTVNVEKTSLIGTINEKVKSSLGSAWLWIILAGMVGVIFVIFIVMYLVTRP